MLGEEFGVLEVEGAFHCSVVQGAHQDALAHAVLVYGVYVWLRDTGKLCCGVYAAVLWEGGNQSRPEFPVYPCLFPF